MTAAQFAWNVFFAFLSALAGVVIGVLWAGRQAKREQKKRAALLRANLKKSFRFNLDRIDQCLDYLQRPQPVIPNFRLDAATPAHILLLGGELMGDAALRDRFDWQRYQLDHLNAKLEYLHQHIVSGSPANLTPSPFESLLQHLRITRSDVTQLLADADTATPSDSSSKS
jgi:hypothetical protein